MYKPFRDIQEAPWCHGLDTEQGETLSKAEVLLQRIEMQRRWNPFSIFGSSPPSVELEDVFGFEVCRHLGAMHRSRGREKLTLQWPIRP